MQGQPWFQRNTMTDQAAPDVEEIRKHFLFSERGRVPTNNAASTQPPRDILRLLGDLAPDYDNVHRGQSDASVLMTELFEDAYKTIAQFLNAEGRESIVLTRNATEAHNAVMYSLMTAFRDGDNVVTTMMEHNANYVPWYALCRDILPRFGVRVECRIVRFNPVNGALDTDHLSSLVDARTKLVCCTGASNFLGTKPPLSTIRAIASESGYAQPHGGRGSLFLIDGAQLVPGTYTDVRALDADYLSFSFHKMFAPFGVGVLYAKSRLLQESPPFLYGGDMIAPGQVTPDYVGYNDLPWKYAAGTPNILGAIVSGQTLRLLLDLVLHPKEHRYFRTGCDIDAAVVKTAMDRVARHTQLLTQRAIDLLLLLPGLTMYGPRSADERSSLVAFNVAGWNPFDLAAELNALGVESRAGCHCATLAHHVLRLDPLASCRLSFSLYNTVDDVDRAVGALARTITRRASPVVLADHGEMHEKRDATLV